MSIDMFEEKVPEGVEAKEVAEVRHEIKDATEAAHSIIVKDQTSFDFAAAFAAECARREKAIDARFANVDLKTKDAKRKADEARSAVLELIRSLKAPFSAAKAIVDRKANAWRAEENKRLQIEAEKARLAEQKRLDDEKAKNVEALKAAGNDKAAEQVAATPVIAQVQAQQVEVPKGTTFSHRWKAVLVDFPALVKAIAAGQAPIELLEFNQSFADGMARAQKSAMRYEGIVAQDIGMVSHK